MFAITVSPDPARIVNKTQRRSYEACTHKEQYVIIKAGIKKAIMNVLMECDDVVDIKVKVYFELNKSSMMHCHGVIEIPEEYLVYFQRMVFRELGRTYIDGKKPDIYLKACCYIISVREYVDLEGKYKSWEEYCNKDQTDRWKQRYPSVEFNYSNQDVLESCKAIDSKLQDTLNS